MYLVGSRTFGVATEKSDWDYIDFDDNISYNIGFINRSIEPHKHCYYFNREYFRDVTNYNISNTIDYCWLNNIAYFKSGASTVNPLSKRDQWIERMRNTNFYASYNIPALYSRSTKKWKKSFYILAYNVECLRLNTLNLPEESMKLIQKFHDHEATQEDYEYILSELKKF